MKRSLDSIKDRNEERIPYITGSEGKEKAGILAEMRKVKRSDPNFRRLKFIRYADDFVVLIVGSLHEARFILSSGLMIRRCMTEKWNTKS
uniref:Uncharacterized protein n=1 Tax=Ophiocordycipitaceae sp. TaxID=1907519 RepID=A0A7S8CTU8_9HYPO|nr:hypothetical protein [Ophiocordycipitaceae sp.]QUT09501.1 hypothetical protein [Ophiocordycipitaceae sp.]QUT09529.1 hypothetical protein [Ophiocordycipitaceae sp.]QUT13259.1 hypothetical protein [Ophiocordycipitaceae sp.]DAJ12180.1 TPA_asm: hypothetical protein [Ophiocordycipitaceae sp.]